VRYHAQLILPLNHLSLLEHPVGYLGDMLMLRRTLSFILASALLLAGIALAGFEITHSETLRPFVLFGAVVIVVAAGLWLLDEFVWPIWRH
jgi:hypothetical protein